MLRPPPDQDARTWVGLRVKLTLWLVAIFLTIQAALAGAVFLYQWRTLDAYFAARIRARSDSLAAKLATQGPVKGNAELLRLSNDLPQYAVIDPWFITLYDATGAVAATTAHPPPVLEETRREAVLSGEGMLVYRDRFEALAAPGEQEEAARALLRRVSDKDGGVHFLLVARLDNSFQSMMWLVGTASILTIPAGAIAAACAGWLITGLMIAPLQHLRRIAGSLTPEAIEQEFVPAGRLSREQQVLEAQLQETRNKLLHSFKAQERFISNVSHELRTPISVVLTEGQTLPLSSLDPVAQKYVLSVNEEMRRLGRMIEGFLTLTKIGNDKSLEQSHPCEVNDVVMEAIAECSLMASQRGVNIHPTLDEGDPPAVVAGVCELLRVMMNNLIRNAIRFSAAGQAVHVTVSSDAGEVRVAIRDHGPGVPEELVSKLFDRFVQGPTEERHSRGYGLGLAIAQGVAELHRGHITVRNMTDGDGGCEFLVRLPTVSSPGGGLPDARGRR